MSRREVYLPPIVLDANSTVPLHRQISDQIAAGVRGGGIPGGVRLPASRVMARLLGVSRNTVLAAYDELAGDGLLEGERGAGMRVASAAPVPAMSMFGLREVIRASGYPARVVALTDPDGNALYLRHS